MSETRANIQESVEREADRNQIGRTTARRINVSGEGATTNDPSSYQEQCIVLAAQRLSHRRWNSEQHRRSVAIRDAAKAFAAVIIRNLPETGDVMGHILDIEAVILRVEQTL